ncbi:MAG TPA: aminoglycoside phosphotransferase [Streptosporangiaceae bacterium]|nr:aminoglycoside phosphotransferase [Streptosporangiaceae bacterium]
MTFEEELAAWLPAQRWFAGKGTPIDGLTIASQTVLVDGDPALHHLIVMVAQRRGSDRYQVLTGLRAAIPDRLEHAVIGPAGAGLTAYDALHDPELTRRLVQAMADQETIGPLRFGAEPDVTIGSVPDSLVLTGEQTNTSLLFGEETILKVFRRPSPGPNPDLEVPRALARLGSRHVAPPLGWLQSTMDGQPTVLAILSEYLKSAADGWSLAATSVRDLYARDAGTAAEAGGDFAPEAHRLGAATAEVHRSLADAFGVYELPAGAHGDLADQMLARLGTALATVPELGPHAQLLTGAFAELATLTEPLVVQRIHGDYHLGQVVRTQSGWVVLDFEGEPATPLAQRRARSPALRDVAGMLRSFDYAARFQLPGHPGAGRVAEAAHDWVSRNQAAFCAGYAQAGGADPGKHAVLLRALLLDKAVYEVMYEARHRPTWLPIPLDAIADAS